MNLCIFLQLLCLYYLIGTILENQLYVKNNKYTKKTKERFLQLKNVITLIENEYQSPLTLEDLSKSAGMAPKYFCRFFHEMINKTPIEYLNTTVLKFLVKNLLQQSFPLLRLL